MLYRVVVRIWDPIWLTVFLLWLFSVYKVTYIYYAIVCRVKYVAYAYTTMHGQIYIKSIQLLKIYTEQWEFLVGKCNYIFVFWVSTPYDFVY